MAASATWWIASRSSLFYCRLFFGIGSRRRTGALCDRGGGTGCDRACKVTDRRTRSAQVAPHATGRHSAIPALQQPANARASSRYRATMPLDHMTSPQSMMLSDFWLRRFGLGCERRTHLSIIISRADQAPLQAVVHGPPGLIGPCCGTEISAASAALRARAMS